MAIWGVPYLKNHHFAGREKVLADLRTRLNSGLPKSRRQVITGIAGIGKTQLVAEYAYKYRYTDDYNHVFWIQSENATKLELEYARLANQLDLPEQNSEDDKKIKAVRDWLERNLKWLLVFDNAPDIDMISDYLPRETSGYVIITSRHSHWPKFHVQEFQVSKFMREESVDLLCNLTSENDRISAELIAEELGDLPLALAQAGVYCSNVSMPLSQYLKLVRKRKIEVLAESTLPKKMYPESLAATWKISFDEVLKTGVAASLLGILAFFASDEIPPALLFGGLQKLPKDLIGELKDQMMYNKGVEVLLKYSFIMTSKGSIAIHPLIQDYTRFWLNEAEKLKQAEAALLLVSNAFSYIKDEPATWSQAGQFLPHVLAVTSFTSTIKSVPEKSVELLNTAAQYLRLLGKFSDAQKCLQRAVRVSRKEKVSDANTAMTLKNLTLVSLNRGYPYVAKRLLLKVLNEHEATFGPQSAVVASDACVLGRVLLYLGEYKYAREQLLRVMEIIEAEQGLDHQSVATALDSYAEAVARSRDIDGTEAYIKARESLLRALRIKLKTYGPNHLRMATTLHRLGNLQALQYPIIARNALKRALKIREAVYGPNHPEVATTLNSLGTLEPKIGQTYLERALEIRRNLYGLCHPDVAETLENIAVALYNYEEGLIIEKRDYDSYMKRALGNICCALAIKERVFGLDHIKVVETLGNLGMIQLSCHKEREALLSYDRAYLIAKKLLGEGAITTKNLRQTKERLAVYAKGNERVPAFDCSLLKSIDTGL